MAELFPSFRSLFLFFSDLNNTALSILGSSFVSILCHFLRTDSTEVKLLDLNMFMTQLTEFQFSSQLTETQSPFLNVAPSEPTSSKDWDYHVHCSLTSNRHIGVIWSLEGGILENGSAGRRVRGVKGGSWLMIGKDEFGVRALILRKGQDPSGDV